MFTRRESRKRSTSRPASHGLRYRRLGIERVEDRCLLAAVAFQTGMEAQLPDSANQAGSISLAIIAGPYLSAGNSSVVDSAESFGPFGTASLLTGTATQQITNGGLLSTTTGLPPAHISAPVTKGGIPLSAANGVSLPPAPADTLQAESSGPAIVWGYTIDNNNGGDITPGGPMQVLPDIVQSGGGSQTYQPIPVGLLPPEAPQPFPVGSLPPATPPSTPQPNPIPPPIDIGLVLNNSLAPIQCPVLPPESGASPVMVSSGPSTNPAPSAAASKPDVEGNRGKSQLFDVAGTQGPQTFDGGAASSGTFVAVSFAPPADQAASATSDAIASSGDTARGDDSDSQASLAIAFSFAEGTVADGANAVVASSEPDAAILPIPAISSATIFENQSPAQHRQSLDQALVVPPLGGKSPKGVTRSDIAASLGIQSASAKAKPEENTGKPDAAVAYHRIDIVGLAVLAIAGQHLGQRWSRYTVIEPRPVVIGRKKLVE